MFASCTNSSTSIAVRKPIEHFGRGAIERHLHVREQILAEVIERQVGTIADDVAVLFQPTNPLHAGRDTDVQLPR